MTGNGDVIPFYTDELIDGDDRDYLMDSAKVFSRGVGRGVSMGSGNPPVKLGLWSLQQEPNTPFS